MIKIKSNLKPILDDQKISIRELSRRTGHSFETLRTMYNDDMERYSKELLIKLMTVLNVKLEDLISVEYGGARDNGVSWYGLKDEQEDENNA